MLMLVVLLGSEFADRCMISMSLCNAHQIPGLLNARYRQVRRIEESHLHEKRRLIPIDVLVRDFFVLEFHHHDVRKFDFLPSWQDPWQQVVPLLVVSEAHNESSTT